jgi:TonB-linked SusC/RagA family outer membrane protein
LHNTYFLYHQPIHVSFMNQSTFTRFLVLMVALFCSVAAFAQTGKITGKIIDEKKEPVMGATVIVAGTTLGSATDMDGNYTIEGVASGEVRVQVSYIGYETKEGTVKVATGKTATLDFSLGENKEMLDAVIITGYGQTQQRRDLTGAISKVDSKAIMAMPTSSFEQSLQGAAAGLQVTQGSGMVGSQSVVRVRGNSSISAGGDPLYVVDGIAITQDYFISKGDNGNTNNNPLSTINPNDIESVEVLKDAAAAAIYGSRGANGVIIITTKRGKKGKPTYNFNTRVGYGEPTKLLKFLTSEEYFAMRQRGWELDGNVGQAPIQPTLAEQGYSRSELEHMNTNWYDEVLRKGVKQEYNLSMRYGGEKLSTYIGTSYSNNQGYVKGNGMERVSGRVNVDYHPIKNLTIGLTTSASRGTIEKQNLLYGGL